MNNGFLSIDDARLKQLSDKDSVILLHELLYSEARRVGLDVSHISVPFNIYDPDGGIDASFNQALSRSITDDNSLIHTGKTVYQVKSGNISYSDSGLKGVLCTSSGQGRTQMLKPKHKRDR